MTQARTTTTPPQTQNSKGITCTVLRQVNSVIYVVFWFQLSLLCVLELRYSQLYPECTAFSNSSSSRVCPHATYDDAVYLKASLLPPMHYTDTPHPHPHPHPPGQSNPPGVSALRAWFCLQPSSCSPPSILRPFASPCYPGIASSNLFLHVTRSLVCAAVGASVCGGRRGSLVPRASGQRSRDSAPDNKQPTVGPV